MWGLFALRTRHPPPCSPSVYRGSTRGAGEGVEKNSSVTPCQGLCQNECFDAAPLRCVRISKMQGIEDEGDRSLLE